MLHTYILISLFLFFSFASAIAQSKETIYLWPDKVPHETSAKSDPVQTPDTSRKVVRITNITNPKLHVYRPKESVHNKGAIIISPGGAYRYLAINIEGYEVAEWLNSLGYTAFVLEYRTPNNRLGALSDLQRAIRMLRNQSGKYAIDKDKIGIMGFSAGGHLSLLASTNYASDSYEKQDDIDKESCRPDFSILMYPGYVNEGKNNSLSPDINLSQELPPLFLFGTADDGLADGFFVLAKALKEVKANVEFHLLPTGGHGYGMRKGNPAAEAWGAYLEKWLNKIISR